MNLALRFLYPAFLCTYFLATAGSASPLPRGTPESQGVSSRALLELVDHLDQRIEGMHSLMIVRHGKVIAEGWWKPYTPERRHILYSLSKSFASTAVGLAVAEKRLSIDDEVIRFFPEFVPTNASVNLKSMRVRDLLTMSTGHQDEPPVGPEAMSARSFLAQPVPHVPGTHFKYNTPATFMQGAIVEKLSGQGLLSYLTPRLLEPLGIENAMWETNFQGIALGGYGLRVRTEDIAKFGQLYLQRGRWQGKQLIPETWVDMATGRQVSNGSNPENDWHQGYGFQFWRARHNAYRGDGAFGQFCIVMPDQDVVIAITSGVRDMGSVMNVLWEKLLPACGPRKLRKDAQGLDTLKQRLSTLGVAMLKGARESNVGNRALNRRIVFGPNDQNLQSLTLAMAEGGSGLIVKLEVAGKTVTYEAAYSDWKHARSAFPAGRLAQFVDEPVAGSYAWTSEDVLKVKLCAVETPFHNTMTLQFQGGAVHMDSEANVGFGQVKKPRVTGRLE